MSSDPCSLYECPYKRKKSIKFNFIPLSYIPYFWTHSQLAQLAIFFKQADKVLLLKVVGFIIILEVYSVFEQICPEILEAVWRVRNNDDIL